MQYTPPVRIIDLSHEPAIRVFADMLREMSAAATSAQTMAALLRAFSAARPAKHIVGVLPEPGRPGYFRLLHSLSIAEATRAGEIPNRLASPEVLRTLPLHSGGIIGEMIGKDTPRIAMDLDVRDDPVLGDAVRGFGVCMALPVFIEGKVRDWSIGFAEAGNQASSADALQSFMTVNLVANSNRALDALNTIRGLNGHITRQLEQIARLQQALLPAEPPHIPGLAIATSYLTSDQSGGDYYDFFELPGPRGPVWGILIADVSGHGAAAATVMAMMHATVHSFCSTPHFSDGAPGGSLVLDPSTLMRFANARLCRSQLEGSFITAFFGIYDPGTSTLRYANCGHPPPRVLRRAHGARTPSRIEALPNADAAPLGIIEDLSVSTSTLSLERGDSIVLYTDGISEVFSPSREMFGFDRLDAAITDADGDQDAIVESIHRALYHHRGSATRDDDQTIVVLRRVEHENARQ